MNERFPPLSIDQKMQFLAAYTTEHLMREGIVPAYSTSFKNNVVFSSSALDDLFAHAATYVPDANRDEVKETLRIQLELCPHLPVFMSRFKRWFNIDKCLTSAYFLVEHTRRGYTLMADRQSKVIQAHMDSLVVRAQQFWVREFEERPAITIYGARALNRQLDQHQKDLHKRALDLSDVVSVTARLRIA